MRSPVSRLPSIAAKPLLVIVGETASGKSQLAIELAKRFNGEIICADSRTVYKGMDVSTAKPSDSDKRRVPHYMIDVVEPNEPFTVADFKHRSEKAINDIQKKGKLPIMVGGSGLYVDAILYDFEFRQAPNQTLRNRLNALSVDELQAEVISNNLPMPRNQNNARHLIRVIETGGQQPNSKPLRPNTLVLALKVDREVLKKRITERVDRMVDEGLSEEIKKVSDKYGWHHKALRTPAYIAFKKFIENEINLEQAKNEFIQNDMQLAKRQRTWFKRNPSIQWLDDPLNAVDFVTTFLSKKQ
ncbi:tRNA (adenosine(37)-N6)-dimethylallyltransferase MiaA [soil metagenome]